MYRAEALKRVCPTCNAQPDQPCLGPKGSERWALHVERRAKEPTMTETKSPEKLTMVHAHQLVSLMLDVDRGFTAKQLTTTEYAKFACMELGFPITAAQVATRVREFGIPRGEAVPVPNTSLQEMATLLLAHERRIFDLTERMTLLEGWVNTTFPSKSPLKVVG